MTCPSTQRLAALVDGELTQNEAQSLAAHLQDCARCTRERERLSAIAATLPAATSRPADDAFVREVGARLPARERSTAGVRWAAGFALAAAGVVLLVLPWPGPDALDSQGTFTPRGGNLSLRQQVGFSAFVHPGSAPGVRRPAGDGELLRPGDGLSFALRNGSGRTLQLMVFGVDAAGEVHWFEPMWTDPAVDPSSVPLASPAGSRTGGVTPEGLRPGAFTVFALFTERPIRVSEVEAALASGGIAAVEALAPGAALQTRKFVVQH